MINILDIIWAEGRTRQICIQDQPTGRAGGWGRVCWWVWLVIGAEPIYLTQLSSIHQLGHDKLISVTRVRIPAECREIETFHLLCNSFKIINSNSASILSLTIKPYSIMIMIMRHQSFTLGNCLKFKSTANGFPSAISQPDKCCLEIWNSQTDTCHLLLNLCNMSLKW